MVRQSGASPISLAHVSYYLTEALRFRNELKDSCNTSDGDTCTHQAFKPALISHNTSHGLRERAFLASGREARQETSTPRSNHSNDPVRSRVFISLDWTLTMSSRA